MIPFLFTDLWYHVNAKKNVGAKYEVITSRKYKQAAKREFQDAGAAGGSSGGLPLRPSQNGNAAQQRLS